MFRDAPSPSGAASRPRRRSRAHERGFYAFRDTDAPERTAAPLPPRLPNGVEAHALLVDLGTRRAGEVIPHPDPRKRSAGETWRVPAYTPHGAMRDLSLLRVLKYLATDGASEHQRGLQPRTGGINLICAWAPLVGWATKDADGREVSPNRLYDAHKRTLWGSRNRLAAAGLVTWEVAQDLDLQDRCTDWTLLAPDVTPEVLELGRQVAERYRDRHPDLEAARPRSARVLGERVRRHEDRCARHMTEVAYAKRIESAPLPTGSPFGGGSNELHSLSESSHRAPADAGKEGQTRSSANVPNTMPPRGGIAGIIPGEGEGEAVVSAAPSCGLLPTVQPRRLRDDQADFDLRLGWVVAGHVEALGGLSWPALSTRAAGRLGRLARLAGVRLGFSVERVAQALVRIQLEGRVQPLALAEAARRLRADLRHHPAMPGAAKRAARRHRSIERRSAQLAEVSAPDWVRTVDGRLLAVSDDAETTHWLLCTSLPADLESAEVRLAVHAAAWQAGLRPDRLGWSEWLLWDRGVVRLVALNGECALVPKETSASPTIRWTLNATLPSEAQRATWKALHARAAPGEAAPPLPGSFEEAWHAIAAAIRGLWPSTHEAFHRYRPPAGRDASDPAVTRGRELIALHGSRAKALRATHPDHGGNADELMAIIAASESLGPATRT